MIIGIADTKVEIERCFPVMVQLRPKLTKDVFIEQVMRQQKEGYKLVFIENDNKIVSIAGFRVFENLISGKFLFVDDFITDVESRSKGYGSNLFDWIIQYAKKEDCQSIQLTSGEQRKAAHRLYHKKGMYIQDGYYFILSLKTRNEV